MVRVVTAMLGGMAVGGGQANQNVFSGGGLGLHNSKYLPEGGFAQGQDRPEFCLSRIER